MESAALKNPLAAPGSPPRRILVRGVNWLGDAVMTTPALLRLRERFPEAFIALLTPEKLRDLWLHHPAINETIAFETGESVFSVAKRIRAGGFDLALVLPNSPRSALETWLARVPHRVGYARPWRNFFLTTAVPSRPHAGEMRKRSVSEIKKLVSAPGANQVSRPAFSDSVHQTRDYLHLAAALGANPEPLPPQLVVTEDEVNAAAQKFNLTSGFIQNRPVFALNPGAEYGPAKRWPAERFAAAAREIQQRTNCFWLILGGAGDVPLASEIESAIGNRQTAIANLAGRTSLRELCAVLKGCRVLLTNDTGPMHIAAALGTRVVVPFGSTSPELTGPVFSGGVPHQMLKSDAPCSPCFLRECPIDFRCMKGITIDRVVAAVLKAAL